MNFSTFRFQILLLVAALAVLTFGNFVEPVTAQARRMGAPGPKVTSVPDQGVELRMIRFHRLPMIELMVNGTGPYRMIVDTGAAGVVLPEATAKKLELPAYPGMPPGLRVQTPGGSVPATIHNIENLKIGEARFGDVWTIALELPFGDDVDGVIGMNVFKECLLNFDYPGNRIVLSHGELPESNNQDILNYKTPRQPDSHPYVDLAINGKTKSTFVDSGMSGWFSVPEKNKDEFDFLSGPVEARMGQSVGPQRTQTMAGRVKALFEVGQSKIENPIVMLGAEQMIGTLFLENFSVTFDAKNKRVRFARESGDPLTQPALRSLGFRLARNGEEMVVQFVLPKSDAAAKGIKVDDIVLAINGVPANEIYDTETLQKLIQTETAVTIKVDSKGEREKNIEIDVMELVK